MSDDKTLDLNSPEVQAAIQAAAEAQVLGLKTKNQELLEKLSKTKSEAETIKSQFSDVDLDEYRAFKQSKQKAVEEDLIAKGDLETLLQQRVQEMRQDLEGKLSTTAQQAELYKSKVLSGYISTAAAQAGVDPNAIDLVALLAQQSGVKLDAHGNPVIVDADGNTRYSKDGTTPLSLNDWLSGLRESKPLLWGTPQGGGSKSNTGGNGQKTASDYTEAEKRELFHSDRDTYNRLFKSQ